MVYELSADNSYCIPLQIVIQFKPEFHKCFHQLINLYFCTYLYLDFLYSKILRKIAMLGFGTAPIYEVDTPSAGNHGSATDVCNKILFTRLTRILLSQ